jgi:hypothetical protein
VTVPHFAVGDGCAVYRGPVTDSSFHRHAAYQAAYQVTIGDEVAMVDDAAVRHEGAVLVVPPMVRHRMLATGPA